MDLRGECVLPASLLSSWQALNDTGLLQQAIPGCEAMVARPGGVEQGLQTAYDLVVGAAVGPVRARFRGTLRLSDLDPPHAYVLRFEGGAGFVGTATGEAAVTLTALTAGTTRLTYVAHAAASGRIAKVGPALIDRAARRLIDHFFERFAAALAQRESPTRGDVSA